jgi:hypothetical protein
MVRQGKPWEKCVQLAIAAVAVVVTVDASAKAAPIAPAPASTSASCRITALALPTQAEIETLQRLMQTYQVTAPPLKPSGVMTRCEFAHALELTLLQFSRLIATSPSAVSKATLETVNRLYASYHVEVTSQPHVEALLTDLPDRLARHRLFSTNVVLFSGEEWSLEPKLNEPPNGKAPAALADIQMLQALVKRYYSTVVFFIFFHQTEQINRSEFADTLNAFGNWATAGTAIHQEDLSTLHRLQAAYANELAYTRAYLTATEKIVRRKKQQKATYEAELALWDRLRSGLAPFDLEDSPKQQEQKPVSPTTKLHVETILELSGTAGGNR